MNSVFKEIHENFRVIVAISFSQRQFVKFHFMLQYMYIVCFVSSWHFSHFILFLVISNTVSIDLTFMAFITFTPHPKQWKQRLKRSKMSFNLIKNFHRLQLYTNTYTVQNIRFEHFSSPFFSLSFAKLMVCSVAVYLFLKPAYQAQLNVDVNRNQILAHGGLSHQLKIRCI